MGVSSSVNVTENVNQIVQSTVQNAMVKAVSNNEQEVKWIFDGTSCKNFDISGNTVAQNITYDAASFNEALQQGDQDSTVDSQIVASSEAMTSGLNFGNISNAMTYVSSVNNISQTIISNVKTQLTQVNSQDITIELKDVTDCESFTSNNNGFTQRIDSIIDIIQSAVQESSQVSDLQNQIHSDANAQTEGLSSWAVVIIAIVFLLILLSPVFIVGSKFGLILAITFIILGIVFILVYLNGTSEIRYYGFSSKKQMKNATEGASVLGKSMPAATPGEAGNLCLAEEACSGFSWNHKTQLVTLYSAVDATSITQDNNLFVADENYPDEEGSKSGVQKMNEAVADGKASNFDWTGLKYDARNTTWAWAAGIMFLGGFIALFTSLNKRGNEEKEVNEVKENDNKKD
jgi:hypothetical protein